MSLQNFFVLSTGDVMRVFANSVAQTAPAHEVQLAEVQALAALALLAHTDPHSRQGQNLRRSPGARQQQEALGTRRLQRLPQLLRREADVLLEFREPQPPALGAEGLGEEAAHHRIAHCRSSASACLSAAGRDGTGIDAAGIETEGEGRSGRGARSRLLSAFVFLFVSGKKNLRGLS